MELVRVGAAKGYCTLQPQAKFPSAEAAVSSRATPNEPTCTQHGPSAFWLLSVVADQASLAPQPQQYITPIMTAMLAFWRMTEIRDLSVEGSSSFSAYFPVFTSMQFYMIQSIRLLSTSSLGWMCHRVVDLTIRTSFLIFCLKFPLLFCCLRKTFCLYVAVKQKRKVSIFSIQNRHLPNTGAAAHFAVRKICQAASPFLSRLDFVYMSYQTHPYVLVATNKFHPFLRT